MERVDLILRGQVLRPSGGILAVGLALGRRLVSSSTTAGESSSSSLTAASVVS
jgi:hypothetical protein